MDIYLHVYSRLLKRNPNKQRPTDEPEEPHNIIIYAGIYHSNNYRRFLDNIGFKTIEYAGKSLIKKKKSLILTLYRYERISTTLFF